MRGRDKKRGFRKLMKEESSGLSLEELDARSLGAMVVWMVTIGGDQCEKLRC